MSYGEPRRESMQEHSREFAARVAHDVDVSDVDSKIDDSIAARFGRGPGSLQQSDVFANQIPTGLISLAQHLSDPQTMRDAIILREILKRPEDRWKDEAMFGAVGDLLG